MFTLWRFKWSLLLLFVFLLNKVAAKWPPDPPPQFYPHNWPQHYIDDFAIDSHSFGNENSIDQNGNDIFHKQIVDDRTLQDLLQANEVADPAAEERRQQKLQWLGSWLFGKQRAQKQQPQQTPEYKLPEGHQQQQLWNLNGNHRQDADIFVYKKAPEIWSYEEEKDSLETEVNENDVNDANANAVNVEEGDATLNTLWDDDYKEDKQAATEPLKVELQTLKTKYVPFARSRRLDYAYIPYTAYKNEQERKLKEAKKTANTDRRSFLPSISAGAMAHLGNFFTDLSKNVRYNEKIQPLAHPQAKLLQGQHPLRQLHEKVTGEHEANAEFLHAIRTYRPSQKIRSLVSMNPRGYHGAQFIDPNYMWVGLVAAKWPPDAPPQYYPHNWHYIDDHAIDSHSFSNENSIDQNGNDIFHKQIVDDRTLQDLLEANEVADPAAEERRQQKLQWLGSWLFGKQRAQEQQPQQTPEYKVPQRHQQQQLWNLKVIFQFFHFD